MNKITFLLCLLILNTKSYSYWGVMGGNPQCQNMMYPMAAGWCDPKSNFFVSPWGTGSFYSSLGQLNIHAMSPYGYMPQHPLFGRMGTAGKYNYLNYYPYFDRKSGSKVWQPGGNYWNGYANAWWYAPRDGAVVTRKKKSNWSSYSGGDMDIEDSPSGGGTRDYVPAPKPSPLPPPPPQKKEPSIVAGPNTTPEKVTLDDPCDENAFNRYKQWLKLTQGDAAKSPLPIAVKCKDGFDDRLHPPKNDKPDTEGQPCLKCADQIIPGPNEEPALETKPIGDTIKLEYIEDCTPENSYLEKDFPEISHFDPTREPKVFKMAQCIAAAQTRSPKNKTLSFEYKGTKRKYGTFGICDSHRGVPRHTAIRPCISKKYVINLATTVSNVAKCYGADPNQLFKLFNHESNFQLNRLNPIDPSTGLGQLVNQFGINDVLRNRTNQKYLISNSQYCIGVHNNIKNLNQSYFKATKPPHVSRSCRLIRPESPPSNQAMERSVAFTALYLDLLKTNYFNSAIEGKFNIKVSDGHAKAMAKVSQPNFKQFKAKNKVIWYDVPKLNQCGISNSYIQNNKNAIRDVFSYYGYNKGQSVAALICAYFKKNGEVKSNLLSMDSDSTNSITQYMDKIWRAWGNQDSYGTKMRKDKQAVDSLMKGEKCEF